MDAGILHEALTEAATSWSIWDMRAEVALGFGQILIGLIIVGLLMMNRSAKRRDDRLAQQHRESQIQFQAIAEQNLRLAEQSKTSLDALRVILERLDPPPQPASG